jgi:hypothetical protein
MRFRIATNQKGIVLGEREDPAPIRTVGYFEIYEHWGRVDRFVLCTSYFVLGALLFVLCTLYFVLGIWYYKVQRAKYKVQRTKVEVQSPRYRRRYGV